MNNMSWYDVCMKRRSIKRQTAQEIPQDMLKDVLDYCKFVINEKIEWRDPHSKVKIIYAHGNFREMYNLKKFGSTKHVIIVTASKGAKRQELMECGYLFEKVVLFCTKMGLATCWISGVKPCGIFNNHLINTKNEEFDPENDVVVSFTPLGYADKKFLKKDKGRHSDEFLFFEGDSATPLDMEKINPKSLRKVYEAFKRAPSKKNLQRWKVVKQGNKFHFITNPSSTFYTNLDIGCAICHWDLVSKELNIQGKMKKLNSVELDFEKLSKIKLHGEDQLKKEMKLVKKEIKLHGKRKDDGELYYFLSFVLEN